MRIAPFPLELPTSTSVAAPAPAAAALRALLRFVDFQSATIEQLAVELCDGRICGGLGAHRDESEAARLADELRAVAVPG